MTQTGSPAPRPRWPLPATSATSSTDPPAVCVPQLTRIGLPVPQPQSLPRAPQATSSTEPTVLSAQRAQQPVRAHQFTSLVRVEPSSTEPLAFPVRPSTPTGLPASVPLKPPDAKTPISCSLSPASPAAAATPTSSPAPTPPTLFPAPQGPSFRPESASSVLLSTLTGQPVPLPPLPPLASLGTMSVEEPVWPALRSTRPGPLAPQLQLL